MKNGKVSIDISVRSFITAVAVIFGLMVLSYILTFIIPSGEYARTVNNLESSNLSYGYRQIDSKIYIERQKIQNSPHNIEREEESYRIDTI